MSTPTVTLDLPEGQSPAGMEAAVADALRAILGGMPPRVVVRTHGAAAPAPEADPVQGSDPAQTLVRTYLAAMEARDLAAARACLATGFSMTFPGGVVLRSPEELVAWSRPRYRFVAKTHEQFDTLGDVVWCFGRLHGEWPDGTPFDGIRYVDRFELRDGLLHRQDVWNDMGEHRTALRQDHSA
ncbi:MAG: nuclear transport factor 2 family protein [Alkalilacustris sp.]